MVFDEAAYLAANADVREAVGRGRFQSGYQHFILFGMKENRLHWPRTGRRSVVFSVSHNRNFFHKLGDLCIAHPTFNAIREQFADCNVYWMTRPELGELIPPESQPSDCSSDCQVIDAAPPGRLARDWLHSNRHPIDFLAETAGVPVEARHRYVDVPVPAARERAVDALNLPTPFVAVAAGPCYTGGNWPLSQRQKVVDLFGKRGVRCVSLGGSDAAALRGTVDLCNRLSLSEAIAVIRRARLYVGPDTGTSWLACAARETPKLCVLDRNRMRDGVVGFAGFLADRNIRDVVGQEGAERCFDLAWALWEGLADEFDEAYYLRTQEDVARAVRLRQFSSGWEHYSRFGRRENRRGRPMPE
jgi:hypothetical protein